MTSLPERRGRPRTEPITRTMERWITTGNNTRAPPCTKERCQRLFLVAALLRREHAAAVGVAAEAACRAVVVVVDAWAARACHRGPKREAAARDIQRAHRCAASHAEVAARREARAQRLELQHDDELRAAAAASAPSAGTSRREKWIAGAPSTARPWRRRTRPSCKRRRPARFNSPGAASTTTRGGLRRRRRPTAQSKLRGAVLGGASSTATPASSAATPASDAGAPSLDQRRRAEAVPIQCAQRSRVARRDVAGRVRPGERRPSGASSRPPPR